MGKWIDVKEKLPEPNPKATYFSVWVLAWTETGGCSIASCNLPFAAWVTDGGDTLEDVTHWMPLPKSPLKSQTQTEETLNNLADNPVTRPASEKIDVAVCATHRGMFVVLRDGEKLSFPEPGDKCCMSEPRAIVKALLLLDDGVLKACNDALKKVADRGLIICEPSSGNRQIASDLTSISESAGTLDFRDTTK